MLHPREKGDREVGSREVGNGEIGNREHITESVSPISLPRYSLFAQNRYSRYYSTARLRQLAGTIKGSRHGDLWQQFNLLVGALSGEERFAAAREALALPALGSLLWNPASTADLNAASLTGAPARS